MDLESAVVVTYHCEKLLGSSIGIYPFLVSIGSNSRRCNCIGSQLCEFPFLVTKTPKTNHYKIYSVPNRTQSIKTI